MRVETRTALIIMLSVIVDSALIISSTVLWDAHDNFQIAMYIVILFWWLPFWMLNKSYKNTTRISIYKEKLS